jgi:hypothetical protein
MTTETNLPSTEHTHPRMVHHTASDAVYGIGVIGALVYYIGHATDFKTGAIGVFKALFWPAFLVFKVLEFMKM